VNLTGVWHTIKATVPSMIAAGKGGSIVITASLAGLVPYAGSAAYVASKHGVNGLMKVLALDLGEHRIRVNSINPSTVDTPMIQNEPTYRLFVPDREGPISREEFEEIARPLHALPIPYISVDDVSELVLWLASDASRHMTGTAIRLDAGAGIK
jgi:NAD(P)-dependent dehydrogenase (short-subunit alcohol dehydrogenase family)